MYSEETGTIARSEQFPPVIAIDIGGTQIRAAITQGSQLHSRVDTLTGENTTPERMLPLVFSLVQQALEEARMPIDKVAGIGVSMPGPLDHRSGVIFTPPNLPGWEQVQLRDIITQRYSLPTYVENDANAAALGEYLFGAGQDCKYMIYLTISTGIGGGIIIDGKLIEGACGTAGELGHMSLNPYGERCACGNFGCLEHLSSGTAIARIANEAIEAGEGADLLAFAIAAEALAADTQPLDTAPLKAGKAERQFHVKARTVAQAAEANIPLARTIMASAGEYLGYGLVNILHIFNPEKIILGGGVMYHADLLMKPALRIVQERTMSAPLKAAQIAQATLGSNSGLIGAGALLYYYQKP